MTKLTFIIFNYHLFCGRRWIRTTEGINQQIYSLPHLATLVFALFPFSIGSAKVAFFFEPDKKIYCFSKSITFAV